MVLSENKSTKALSTFVESYWRFEAGDKEQLIFFPDGTFNIFFATEQFVLVNDRTIHAAGVYLTPITSVPVELFSRKNIYGIRFKAFSLVNLFAKNISSLGLINNIETLYSSEKALNNLRKMFVEKQSPEEITAILEMISFELLTKNFTVNASLRDQVNYILDLKGQVRISEMAGIFGVTRQGLHKHFKQSIFVSPKELAAIWRLNHFFTLSGSSDDTLTGKALDAGFYDQAHFIHCFKEKYSLAPTQFIKAKTPAFLYARESMSKRFSNYYDPEI